MVHLHALEGLGYHAEEDTAFLLDTLLEKVPVAYATEWYEKDTKNTKVKHFVSFLNAKIKSREKALQGRQEQTPAKVMAIIHNQKQHTNQTFQ